MEVYYERLTVSAVERSRVITVEFLSEDPELAAKVVNAIVDAYMKVQQQAKLEQTRSASAYLANEIKQLRKTVQEADAKVEDFRAKANLYIGNNDQSLNTQQLGELTTQLATARSQKADLDARSKAIRDMLKSGKQVESADIVNSDLLKRLVEQRVLLRAQLAEQASTLLERHPRIQELNAQINALDTQMRGELERLVTSIENDARIAASRIDQTNDAIDRLKKQISGASPQDVQLRALEREAKAQRDLLESYLARYREATARENIDAAPAEARVISRASVSNVPAYPEEAADPARGDARDPVPRGRLRAVVGDHAAGRADAQPGAARAGRTPFRQSRCAGNTGTGAVEDAPLAVRHVPAERRATSRAPSRPELRIRAASRACNRGACRGVRPGRTCDRGAGANSCGALGESGRRIAVIGPRAMSGRPIPRSRLRARSRRRAGGWCSPISRSPRPISPSCRSTLRPRVSRSSCAARRRSAISSRATSSRASTWSRPAGSWAMRLRSCASPRLAVTLEALARAYDHVVIDAGAHDRKPGRHPSPASRRARYWSRPILPRRDDSCPQSVDRGRVCRCADGAGGVRARHSRRAGGRLIAR